MNLHVSLRAWSLPGLLLWFTACARDEATSVATEGGTFAGFTSGGETVGADTGAPTTGDAAPSRALCDRYIACIGATTPGALPAAQEGFGDGSVCWQGDADSAQQCVDACDALLDQYRDMFPDEIACGECTADDECDTAAGEACVKGECSLCGNGAVDATEICDGQAACDPDCAGPAKCSPVTGVGCVGDERCSFNVTFELDNVTFCYPSDEFTLVGAGEVCSDEGTRCVSGNFCLEAAVLVGCAGDACCTPFCDRNAADACAAGTVCTRYQDALASLGEFRDEGLDYVGVCVVP